jgi:hypothetical protein
MDHIGPHNHTITRESQRQPGPRTAGSAAEAVQGAALALERVDDVEGRDRLALGVLGVGDGVADDRLQEGLEDAAGLLVDHCRRSADAREDRAGDVLAEIRLTPPRRARRRMAGFVMPWMLSRKILR